MDMIYLGFLSGIKSGGSGTRSFSPKEIVFSLKGLTWLTSYGRMVVLKRK
jgi:hypothetical protein